MKYSCFDTNNGSGECFIVITSSMCDLQDALTEVDEQYEAILKKEKLSHSTEVFRRVYLSDPANQNDVVLKSNLLKKCLSNYSIIGQSPLYNEHIAIFSYHIRKPLTNYKLLFSSYTGNTNIFDSNKQTYKIFSDYNSFIEKQGYSMLKNAIRTWIYVRDIDNHYAGMVEARKNIFAEKGLTKDTRFIASTGIEGVSANHRSLVCMDTLSVLGIKPEQIIRMEARNNLNPTHEYGVTFERGTKLSFGDRDHLYISGTASIDKYGKVMYLNDIKKQTERTLDNIEALLYPHNSTIKDMKYFIVYVRDPSDVDIVRKVIEKRCLNNLPVLYLRGAVCRPSWLVEIEGEAIIQAKNNWPDFQ